jgi:hypothetical protein
LITTEPEALSGSEKLFKHTEPAVLSGSENVQKPITKGSLILNIFQKPVTRGFSYVENCNRRLFFKIGDLHNTGLNPQS